MPTIKYVEDDLALYLTQQSEVQNLGLPKIKKFTTRSKTPADLVVIRREDTETQTQYFENDVAIVIVVARAENPQDAFRYAQQIRYLLDRKNRLDVGTIHVWESKLIGGPAPAIDPDTELTIYTATYRLLIRDD